MSGRPNNYQPILAKVLLDFYFSEQYYLLSLSYMAQG